MRVALRDGRLDLSGADPAAVHLRGLRPEVLFWREGARHSWRPLLLAAGDGFESAASEPLQLRLTVAAHAGGLLVRATLRNRSTADVQISRLAPLSLAPAGECRIGASPSDWNVFRHGYQSWTGTRSFRANETDRDPVSSLLRIGLIDVRNPSPAQPGEFRSDLFAAIQNQVSGAALVLGFLTCRNAFGGVEVGIAGARCTHLAAALDYDEVRLEAGAELVTDALWLAAGSDVHDLLEAYAQAAGVANQARVAERNPTGWCSWYYYFTRITEARVLENLRALTQQRQRFPCDYVQVDDGYQAAIGDWLNPNRKFPYGMAWLAEQIRDAGFDAGIWTAPFIAKRDSRLLDEHPEWFVKNDEGGPCFALLNPMWGWGGCYALDTTHPEVLEWLRHTFQTISREWGYRILKLDFLFAAALPGKRFDRNATRAQALRRGLEAIRAAAGNDAFLLGCGCPLGPAIGVVDAMRIGPDVAPFWSNFASRVLQRDQHGLATKHAIRNTLTRAFLHRRWWLNDPDCLMVRDTKTRLSLDEVRSLATAIATTDGMIVLSDRVEQLSAQAYAVLDRTLALAGGQPRVMDLLSADIPEVVVSRGSGRSIVAVFNFNDQPCRKEVDLRALGVAGAKLPYANDVWTGVSVSIADGVANLGELPAHACRVFVFEDP